jgi:Animal haem peroxidase
VFGRISSSEVISGIPGGPTDTFGVPFALTEEFVAVYRMHPLVRDDWNLRAPSDDRQLRAASFLDLAGPLVGMFAERLPAGFAFSDTAFRIVILMASRRLNSDRFFTEYYLPEVYTRAGLDWIDHNTSCGRPWPGSPTRSSRGTSPKTVTA